MATPTAYSYIRFSHPSQATGDSLRRQTEAAATWCEKHQVRLDTSVTLHDLGKSAFTGEHRKNPDRYALAAFLKLVQDGKVSRGSYLLVENLDRLSREHVRPALTLLLNLIEAGVRVVQLSPVEVIYDEDVDPMQLMMAIMELSRGHGESQVKSDRVGKAWKEKKRNGRHGQIITRMCPAWLRVVDGEFGVLTGPAHAIREIYRLASEGYGSNRIVKRLNKDGIPPFGPSGKWQASYISLILKDRRTLGEFQPRNRDGSEDGEVIKDYFPAILTEQEWYAARASRQGRTQPTGTRQGKHCEIFAGLLKDSAINGSFYINTRTETINGEKVRNRVLMSLEGHEGRDRGVSFPWHPLESSILASIREVPRVEIIGERDDLSSKAQALRGKLAETEINLAGARTWMASNGFSPAIAQQISTWEAQEASLRDDLQQAEQEASSPLNVALDEALPLLWHYWDVEAGKVEGVTLEETRVKLRSILRRLLTSVEIVIARKGKRSLAVFQLHFVSGQSRTYTVWHQAGKANASARTGATWSCQPREDLDAYDLRQQADAQQLLSHLQSQLTLN